MRIRGPLTLALALALALALSLTACGKPTGLANWPALSEPKGWEPTAGVCLDTDPLALRRFPSGTAECTQWHRAETVHIGQLADAANLEDPPKADDPIYLKTWADCDAKTSEYLGGPWRERRVRIGVAFPLPDTWDSGARWYACHASLVDEVGGTAEQSNFALKGVFATEAQLSYGCAQASGDGDWTNKPCDQPHNVEFAGVMPWDTTYAEADAEVERDNSSVHRKCREVIGAFVGATVRTGTYVWMPREADWKLGDKSIRCFFWIEARSVSKSMRGVGRSGWPLR